MAEKKQNTTESKKNPEQEKFDKKIKALAKELEEAKNRHIMLDETVLVNLPGTSKSDESDEAYVSESEAENVYSDNISEEVPFDEIPVSDSISYAPQEQPILPDDVVGSLKKITDAKLKEGKNEK